ncbi:carbohydrate deacetylase [Erysipelothrix urinaevulpis]|uniref:carbohydrate deacetylase n=1 Tax=Erysipelothrix urinaevulpis TaxID=2683717 RepID=UPI00135C8787|nr:carbohydrate deacetylase [Erysipelothrix urinaevulpis]
MGKVIINADDFGYSRGINYAIVDSHQLGILTSTTIMAGMPGFEHAVELSKSNPNLGIGVHLTLTCGYPLLKDHKTIIDSSGRFKNLAFFTQENDYDLEEVYREWEAQIEKVIAAGINPSHLDSHHHTHSFPKQQAIVVKLARKYNLPVRNNLSLPSDIVKVNRFEPLFDTVAIESEEALKVYLANVKNDIEHWGTVEIMVHPGYLDSDVYQGSSLTENRSYVADFLMNSTFAKTLKKSKVIKLISYHELSDR